MPQPKNTPGLNTDTATTEEDWSQRFIDAKKRGKNQKLCQIGKGDGLNPNATPDTNEDFTIWVRPYENPEPTVAYFRPGFTSYSTLTNNLWFYYSIDVDTGKLWLEKPADDFYLDVLNGEPPPTNGADFIHTHENDAQCGTLNASNIFSAGIVDEQFGGTGQSSYTIGDLLYASAAGVLSKLADVATGNALISGGVGAAPAWGKIGLATHVSGLLPLANGGTNVSTAGLTTGALIAKTATTLSAATLTSGAVMVGGAAGVPTFVAPGADGNVLTVVGGAWASATPSSGSTAWTVTSGVIHPTTLLNNVSIGTNANIAKLAVVGDTDEIQFSVRAFLGQLNNTIEIHTPTSVSSIFTITPDGTLIWNDSGDGILATFKGDTDPFLFIVQGTNNRIAIGGTLPAAKLHVKGTEDLPVLILNANATQTANMFELRESGGTNVLISASGLGGLIVNEQGNDVDSRVEGNTDANLTYWDAGADRVGIGTSAPGAKLDIRGGLIVNEDQGDFDLRWESDTTTHALFGDASVNGVGFNSSTVTAFITAGASTTAQAPLRLITGTAPTSPNAGDAWADSARTDEWVTRGGGMTAGLVRRVYGQHSTVGGSNTTSAINLIGGSVFGTATIPTGFWVAGRNIRFTASGYWSTGGVSRTVTITLALGGTTLMSQAITGSVVTAGRRWYLEAQANCRTTGSSGTVFSQGWGDLFVAALDRLENTTTSTHNMTGNLALTLTATFGTADGNTQFQCTNLEVWSAV